MRKQVSDSAKTMTVKDKDIVWQRHFYPVALLGGKLTGGKVEVGWPAWHIMPNEKRPER